MLKKICPHCGKKVIGYNEQYCPECKVEVELNKKAGYRKYKARRTDIKEQEFYLTKGWKITRAKVLNYYKGLDIYQFIVNHKIVYADMVHHIVELKDDWDKRYEFDNLIPLSNDTHQYIHQLYKEDKTKTQELLRQIIIKYNEMMNVTGINKNKQQGRGI